MSGLEFEWEPLIKLLVAGVLGGVIGLERGTHGRPAGLRTHALVCIASTLLMIVSRTGALSGLNGPDNFMLNVDPSRMAAGIVTGIGFLGAGAILQLGGNLVRGLTTAAAIWFVAAVGIAIGVGAYPLAAGATAGALLILAALDKIEERLGTASYRTLVVQFDAANRQVIHDRLDKMLGERKIQVQRTDYELDSREALADLTFHVRLRSGRIEPGFIDEITALEGVARVKLF